MTQVQPLKVATGHPNAIDLIAIHTRLGELLEHFEELATNPVQARGDILKMLLELIKELLPIILPLLIEPLPVPDAT